MINTANQVVAGKKIRLVLTTSNCGKLVGNDKVEADLINQQ